MVSSRSIGDEAVDVDGEEEAMVARLGKWQSVRLRDAMGCPAGEGVRGESREQRVASAKRDRTIANDDELDDVTAGVGDNEGRRGRQGVEVGGVGPPNKGWRVLKEVL
ncbi:hypothetical protein GW17_00022997 [Ensete ventricosum]|nr:hypothetical protein GW17_00022997 [Ensete ventricosum]